jgi:hypothetical protein
MHKIYKYTNKINGKVYIGQTARTLKERSGLNGFYYVKEGMTPFANAILKYGWDNFEPVILEENILTQEDANAREIFFIKKYNSTNRKIGYNATYGGSQFKQTPETKITISNGIKKSKIFASNNFNAHAIKIIAIDEHKNIIKSFDSIVSASKYFNIDHAAVRIRINHFTLADGVRLMYSNKDYKYLNKDLYKKVCSVDGSGKTTGYESVIDAVLANSYWNASFLIRSANSFNKEKYRYDFDNKFWHW